MFYRSTCNVDATLWPTQERTPSAVGGELATLTEMLSVQVLPLLLVLWLTRSTADAVSVCKAVIWSARARLLIPSADVGRVDRNQKACSPAAPCARLCALPHGDNCVSLLIDYLQSLSARERTVSAFARHQVHHPILYKAVVRSPDRDSVRAIAEVWHPPPVRDTWGADISLLSWRIQHRS